MREDEQHGEGGVSSPLLVMGWTNRLQHFMVREGSRLQREGLRGEGRVSRGEGGSPAAHKVKERLQHGEGHSGVCSMVRAIADHVSKGGEMTGVVPEYLVSKGVCV